MTRSVPTSPAGHRSRRSRYIRRRNDRLGALLVVLLAALAGIIAASLATPQSWEQPQQGTRPPTTADVQGSP